VLEPPLRTKSQELRANSKIPLAAGGNNMIDVTIDSFLIIYLFYRKYGNSSIKGSGY